MSIPTTEIRVGLIGCGRIAGVHRRYLQTTPGVRIVGVCDMDLERARAFGAEAGAEEVCRDAADLLRLPLDAVHVLTPPSSHAETAIAALERGVHVLVEKPMATTAAAAERMQAAAVTAGRILSVDHNRLFDPVIVQARQLVAAGAIGNLLSVEAYQGVNVQEGGPAAAPLAMWLNLGPHPLYLLRAFVGEIAEWQAVGGPMGELRAVLRGSQALGFLCFSPGATPYLNALTLRGTKATLHIDLNTMTLLRQRPRRLPSMLTKAALNIDQAAQLVASTVRTSWRVATRRMGTYPGIGAVIRGFHAAVQNQGEPPVSAADGRVVVDLLEQLWTRTHDARATVTRPRPTAPRPSSNGSTVLVTGASGFLGQHVLAALRERGHHVRAMVRFPRLSEEWQDVEEVVAALGDDASIAQALEGVDAVVHCAARVARSGNRADFFRDNVSGTSHLLAAAAAAGVKRFVHVSSIGVYGVPPKAKSITEQTPYDSHPERRGAYTWSKIEADRVVQEFARKGGLSSVILRPGILVGPGGPEFTARLCLGRFGSRVVIVGRRGARLPLCHVADAARAAALAVTARTTCTVYNLVDEGLTQEEWLRQRTAAGWAMRPVYVPPPLALIPAFALEVVTRLAGKSSPLSRYKIRRATESLSYDTTRASLELGWKPLTGVRGVVASTEQEDRAVRRLLLTEPARTTDIAAPDYERSSS